MNANYKISYLIGSLLITMITFTSCDLELQESYDFDESASIYDARPPFDQTIWEFMNEQPDFDLMVEAVQFAGMENVFSGGQDDKTILLLRQSAMESFLKDQGATTVSDIPVETWRHFLKRFLRQQACFGRCGGGSRWNQEARKAHMYCKCRQGRA